MLYKIQLYQNVCQLSFIKLTEHKMIYIFFITLWKTNMLIEEKETKALVKFTLFHNYVNLYNHFFSIYIISSPC